MIGSSVGHGVPQPRQGQVAGGLVETVEQPEREARLADKGKRIVRVVAEMDGIGDLGQSYGAPPGPAEDAV